MTSGAVHSVRYNRFIKACSEAPSSIRQACRSESRAKHASVQILIKTRSAVRKKTLVDFSNFLLLVLYLFVPWTAVNLVDYYIVRRGHYAIAEIFKPDGMYGRWGWRGVLAYLIGFAAMTPFFHVGTLYEGAAAKALGGADISFFIGLPVAGILYYVFSRSIDVAAETRVAEAEAAGLERAAAEHRLP